MKHLSIAVLGLFSLSACSTSPEQKFASNNTIHKVTIAGSAHGCDSACPFEVLSIDDSLIVRYYGGWAAHRKGYYQGTIKPELWDNIQSRLKKIASSGITVNKSLNSDHPEIELIINSDSTQYRFKDNSGFITPASADSKTIFWFMKLVSQADSLKRVDYLDFDTSLQYDTAYMNPPPDMIKHYLSRQRQK